MKQLMRKFYRAFGAICIIAAAALTTPMNSALARQQVLTGTIEAQYICHDGANRGATIAIWLGKSRTQRNFFLHYSWKGYYTATQCANLTDYSRETYYHDKHVKPGDIVHVWWAQDIWGKRNPSKHELCADFQIRYTDNGKTVWVQNGGSAIWNVNCIAKDGL